MPNDYFRGEFDDLYEGDWFYSLRNERLYIKTSDLSDAHGSCSGNAIDLYSSDECYFHMDDEVKYVENKNDILKNVIHRRNPTRVEVLKCSDNEWYIKEVGFQIDVLDECDPDYYTYEDKLVLREDCKVIKERIK